MKSASKLVSNTVETEAKISVASFLPVKRRLTATGGRLTTRRTRETNTLFDARGGALRSTGRSLRVRTYGSHGSITLKGVARVAEGLKSRVELETDVTSSETMALILTSLGFVPLFRYEKFREVWRLGESVICLDETPLGRFVEIEGTPAAIHAAAAQLGFDRGRFLSTSYPALWFEAGRTGDMQFTSRSKSGLSRRVSGPSAKRTR